MATDDEPRVYTSPVGALGFSEMGTEDDPGCVGCGVPEILGQHKEPILFEHRGGRYWHLRCAESVLSRTERMHRPRDYAQRTTEEQWAIDKKLGLLDEPVDDDKTSDGEESEDERPIRLTPLGEEVAREVLKKVMLTVDELASFLGMSTLYFLDLLKAGELPPVTLYVEDAEAYKQAWLASRDARIQEIINKDYEEGQ